MRPRWSFAGMLILVCLLSACKHASTVLPPEQVLTKATEAGRDLRSARFTLHLETHRLTAGDISLQIEGQLQNGGQQIAATVTGALMKADMPLNGVADIRIVSPGEQYIRLHNLSLVPAETADTLMNKWWRLPSTQSGSVVADVTPDPDLLHLQSSVVKVTRDDGIVNVGGTEMYHYVVAVDPEKLKAFLLTVHGQEEVNAAPEWLLHGDIQGEMWIDAQSFVLRRAEWNLLPSDTDPADGKFSIELNDINQALPVSVPADAPLLPLQVFGAGPAPQQLLP